MEVVASTSPASSPSTLHEAAGMLRRFIDAVESGHLMAATPQDDAIIQHLQEELRTLETVAGDVGEDPGRAE